MAPKTRTEKRQHDELVDLVEMYDISLRAAGRSERTRDWYLWALKLFHDYLAGRGDLPLDPSLLTREHIELFLADMRERPSERTGKPLADKSYLGIYNTLHIFFNWLVDRDEIPISPMAKMHAPSIQKTPPSVIDEENLRRLLAHLRRGKDFLDRRDYALVVMYLDTGCRREELISANIGDINWESQTLRVRGKGNKSRDVSFADEAALVFRQYVRARRNYLEDREITDQPTSPLWLGRLGGRMTGSSVLLMLRRRSVQCGVTVKIWTHLLRHTWAHLCLEEGMDTGDLKRLGGWETDKMVSWYGSSEAARRAQKRHKQFSPGNRLLGKDKRSKKG